MVCYHIDGYRPDGYIPESVAIETNLLPAAIGRGNGFHPVCSHAVCDISYNSGIVSSDHKMVAL